MSKKVDLNQCGNSNDRLCQHEARPSSGSDNRDDQGSQSGGAGSASKEKGPERDNGLSVILGGGSPAIAGSSKQQSTELKSKTPNSQVQASRARQVARENGSCDTSGRKKK
jgi:hypothetical protein